MNKAFMIFQLFSAIMDVLGSDKFKDTMDGVFDLLEDNFPNEKKLQKACAFGRMVLAVPDDDD
jgi:hypothetical protein